MARFSTEYSGFSVKRYERLQDRFINVDSIGYIVGLSIKDAAENNPALVVKLSSTDSVTLRKCFTKLWLSAK